LTEASRARVSLELRDFFAAVDHQLLYTKAVQMNLDDIAGVRATRDEAILAMPIIRKGMAVAGLQHRKNDRQGLDKTMAQLQLLVALFRIAEDMGYEW
jgi:hypothetical protein